MKGNQFTFSEEIAKALNNVAGKKDRSLLDHLVSTGEIAENLVERIFLPCKSGQNHGFIQDCESLKKLIVLQAYLHDLGKLDKRFQEDKKNNPERPSSLPHALFSLPLAEEIIKKNGYENLDKNIIAFMMVSIASHHSVMHNGLYEKWKYSIQNKPQYMGLESRSYESAYTVFEKYKKQITTLQTRDWRFIYVMFNGLLRLADWLDSAGGKEEIKHTYLEAPDETMNKVKTYMKGKNFELRDYQREASLARFDSAYMKLPTGDGKTETALLPVLDGVNKVIYTLPTITSVESMRERFEKMFGSENVSFSHHLLFLSLYQDGIFDEKEIQYERLVNKYNIKKYVVTTIDKILLSVVNYDNYPLVESSLNNSYLIVDEIHSYSPYTLSFILHALEYLKNYHNTRILVMSATLPSLIQEKLEKILGAKQLLSEDLWKKRYSSKARVKVSFDNGSMIDSVKEAALSKKYKKILVVYNTVDRATKAYKELKNSGINAEILLVHARFTYKDKLDKYKKINKIEEQEKEQEKPIILVSTQVVEVSLDIDYDIMFTEVSPFDSLVQRFGRVNRRGTKSTSEVHIFINSDSNLPYTKEQLKETLKILNEFDFKSELDFVNANDRYYEALRDSYEKELGKNPLDDFRYIDRVEYGEKLLTRDKFFTIPAVPMGNNNVIYNKIKDMLGKYSNLKVQLEIMENTVDVPIYMLKGNFVQDEDLHTVFISADYDPEFGLILRSNAGLIY